MLAFFPTPYPDELLYSVIARYSQYIGYTNSEAVRESLFGSTDTNVQGTLPCGIDHLIESLPPSNSLTADYLIRNHTLYRWYAIFLNASQRTSLYQTMRSPISPTKKSIVTNLITTQDVSNRFGFTRYMQYCPACVTEDRKRYGETYWRRSFQIFPMYKKMICPIHDLILTEGSVSIHTMTTYKEFCSAEQEIAIPAPSNELVFEPYIDQRIKTSALEIDSILQNDVADTHCPEARYASIFLKTGLFGLSAFFGGRMMKSNPKGVLSTYIVHTVLESARLAEEKMSSYANADEQMTAIFGHSLACHIGSILYIRTNVIDPPLSPTFHFYILSNLGINFTDFISLEPLTSTHPRLPCLNIFCRFYKTKTISDYHMKYHYIDFSTRDRLYISGTSVIPLGYSIEARCDCGFQYIRREKLDTDIYHIDKIHDIGSVWLAGIMMLGEDKSLSMDMIAKRVGISLKELNRVISYYKIPFRQTAQLREIAVAARALEKQYRSKSIVMRSTDLQLPTPYPDELLYSLIARYADHRNLTDTLTIHRQLFNSSKIAIEIAWSNGLPKLFERLPAKYPLSTYIDIASKLTLFRLYAPFLDAKKKATLDTYLQRLTGDASKLYAPWQINHDHSLSYCPLCVKDDRETYGETYWRRLFQAKSVIVCPVHDVFLETSGVVLSKRYIHSAEKTIQSIPHPRFLDLQQPSHLSMKLLAEETAWILEHDLQPETGFLSSQYKQLIEQFMKRASISQPVSQNDIVRIVSTQLADRYSPELLQLFQCEFDPNDAKNWIGKLIHKPMNQPLLHHLLLLAGMDMRVAEFMNSQLRKPKLKLKHPCLNSFCQHYRELRIDEVEINKDRGKTSYIYSCECGFAYYRLPENMEKDIYYMDGISRLGSQRLSLFLSLWFDESLSMDSVAEKMNIPAHDIHCIVSIHNIFTSNRSKEIPYVSRKVKEFWEQMNAGEKEVVEVSDYHLMAGSRTEE